MITLDNPAAQSCRHCLSAERSALKAQRHTHEHHLPRCHRPAASTTSPDRAIKSLTRAPRFLIALPLSLLERQRSLSRDRLHLDLLCVQYCGNQPRFLRKGSAIGLQAERRLSANDAGSGLLALKML